jgi:glycosyltransferase involved in cell wall biosynthesis
VLLAPALWPETFSFVVREGLLAEVWVVASDLGVMRELIRSGENGQLVAPGDVEAWTSTLRQIARARPSAEAPPALTFQPMTPKEHGRAINAMYQEVLEAAPA